MANVANTKNTGPAAKNTVSGGKKFPMNGSAPRGNGFQMGNTSDGVHKTILGLKYKNGDGFGTVSEKTFTGAKAPK